MRHPMDGNAIAAALRSLGVLSQPIKNIIGIVRQISLSISHLFGCVVVCLGHIVLHGIAFGLAAIALPSPPSCHNGQHSAAHEGFNDVSVTAGAPCLIPCASA